MDAARRFGRPTTEVEGAGIPVSQVKTYWVLKDSTALFLAPFSEGDDCSPQISTPAWQKAHPKAKVDF